MFCFTAISYGTRTILFPYFSYFLINCIVQDKVGFADVTIDSNIEVA